MEWQSIDRMCIAVEWEDFFFCYNYNQILNILSKKLEINSTRAIVTTTTKNKQIKHLDLYLITKKTLTTYSFRQTTQQQSKQNKLIYRKESVDCDSSPSKQQNKIKQN